MLSQASRCLIRLQRRRFATAAAARAAVKDAASSLSSLEPVQTLPDAGIETFQQLAFKAALPALLPRGSFLDLPAVSKWFIHSPKLESSGDGIFGAELRQDGLAVDEKDTRRDDEVTKLNVQYLSRFGDAVVPLELTVNDRFTRIEETLQFFLDATTSLLPTPSNTASTSTPKPNIYLAQAPLPDLPQQLIQPDLPTPPQVLQAGKGDIYNSSLWLGHAPTYTPLHRDPNPNFFVQLAGRKRVRLLPPKEGGAVFARVREVVGGGASGAGSAAIRGVEMMEGREKEVLEEVVWGRSSVDSNTELEEVDEVVGGKDGEGLRMWEAEVGPGDALFIPLGWWHSVKGIGRGMTGSVNWWFR